MPVTNYIWDVRNDNLLVEKDGSGQTTVVYTNEPRQYGRVISQHRGGQTSYYHYNGQGSTRQLTDDSENVTDTATYTAFGETVAKTGATVNPFGYKGALGYYANPETDDVYVRARSYEPSIARWLSPDPYGLENQNLFTYVNNNPANIVDPSGHQGINALQAQQLPIASMFQPATCRDYCWKVSNPGGIEEGYIWFGAKVTGNSCHPHAVHPAKVHFVLFNTTAMLGKGLTIRCGQPAQDEMTRMRNRNLTWSYKPQPCGNVQPVFRWLPLPFFDSVTKERCHSGLWIWECPVDCTTLPSSTCWPTRFCMGLHGPPVGLDRFSLYAEAVVDWGLCCDATCDIKARWIWYNRQEGYVLRHEDARCGFSATEALIVNWEDRLLRGNCPDY